MRTIPIMGGQSRKITGGKHWSAVDQKRSSRLRRATSGLLRTTDMVSPARLVRFVPRADIYDTHCDYSTSSHSSGLSSRIDESAKLGQLEQGADDRPESFCQ